MGSRIAGCFETTRDASDADPPGNPFVGNWESKYEFVAPNGYHRPSRQTMKIDGMGRFLFRAARNVAVCLVGGYGDVPLSWRGKGQFVTDGSPQFHATGRSTCHPRNAPAVRFPGSFSNTYEYDEVADVMFDPAVAVCWWRKGSGGPRDCKAFWRGTPAKTSTADDSSEEAASPVVEAIASPDSDEG